MPRAIMTTANSFNFKQAKQNMLAKQIREQFMLDSYILELLSTVPREYFVPDNYRNLSFGEITIPIGHDQMMMTPNEEARMLQALSIQPQDTILEIGTGTGYITALLAKLGKKVISVDIFPDFISEANNKLSQLNIDNVELVTADATEGLKQGAPYDVICITAGLPSSSVPYLQQYLQHLQLKGRLFAVIGEKPAMTATLIKRLTKKEWQSQQLFETQIPVIIDSQKRELFVF